MRSILGLCCLLIFLAFLGIGLNLWPATRGALSGWFLAAVGLSVVVGALVLIGFLLAGGQEIHGMLARHYENLSFPETISLDRAEMALVAILDEQKWRHDRRRVMEGDIYTINTREDGTGELLEVFVHQRTPFREVRSFSESKTPNRPVPRVNMSFYPKEKDNLHVKMLVERLGHALAQASGRSDRKV